MTAYYNEIEPYAAQWLRNLITKGLIADGEVDTRSIVDVQPAELAGFTQCHFFAGIGGWSYAARLAGWPDDRPLWTGSAPCQPFSVAGKGEAQKDKRHLWPVFFELIRACRPPVIMGEQVAAAVGKDWLDGVCADLEGVGYACGATVVPACAVDAPHRRDRLWFVANAVRGGQGLQRRDDGEMRGVSEAQRGPEHSAFVSGRGRDADSSLADATRGGYREHERDTRAVGLTTAGDESKKPKTWGVTQTSGDNGQRNGTFWSDAVWLTGADGKARRVEPSIRLLAHGVPARVGRLRAYGNAIVPQVAAEVIAAFMEAQP
jgi:DNA (cytosine-5)-methyltransferase 1